MPSSPEPLTSYTIERTFPVPPERLFRAFTNEEEIKTWIWGEGAQVRKALVEPESGGRYHVVMENGHGMRGMVLVYVPGERLIHTLHWDAPVGYNADGMDPIDEVIAMQFEAHEDGSLLRYTHQGIPDDGQSAPEHERSVRATFDGLAKRLATAG